MRDTAKVYVESYLDGLKTKIHQLEAFKRDAEDMFSVEKICDSTETHYLVKWRSSKDGVLHREEDMTWEPKDSYVIAQVPEDVRDYENMMRAREDQV